MKTSGMRFFLISCLLILLVSCSYSTSRGFIEQSPTKDVVVNNYFSDLDKDYVYKAILNIYKHRLSGIFIVKKINTNHHRIVFTTEFGKKIFDFELIKNDFIVNYINDQINKKKLIRTLNDDFQLLINQNNAVMNEFYSETESIYLSKMSGKYYYNFYNKNNDQLEKIVMASKNREMLTIVFQDFKNNLAQNIVMNHHNLKISMELRYINN